MIRIQSTRRSVLHGGAALAAVTATPAILRAQTSPSFAHGVQSGDVDMTSGMIWARVDRPSRVRTEISTTEDFAEARELAPMDALPESDLAIIRLVSELPAGTDVFYRFTAQDLGDVNAVSRSIVDDSGPRRQIAAPSASSGRVIPQARVGASTRRAC
jgi:alkaline phosphatase D